MALWQKIFSIGIGSVALLVGFMRTICSWAVPKSYSTWDRSRWLKFGLDKWCLRYETCCSCRCGFMFWMRCGKRIHFMRNHIKTNVTWGLRRFFFSLTRIKWTSHISKTLFRDGLKWFEICLVWISFAKSPSEPLEMTSSVSPFMEKSRYGRASKPSNIFLLNVWLVASPTGLRQDTAVSRRLREGSCECHRGESC